jgi:hypothetical protein
MMDLHPLYEGSPTPASDLTRQFSENELKQSVQLMN